MATRQSVKKPADKPKMGGSRYPDLFAALATPFEASEIKKLPKGGRLFDYITARTAMIRMDEVLGPENWWDTYLPGADSVICKLSIRLPDGSVVTKEDAGGYAGMSDQGDDDKSGFSDAFKRACAKFGIGRYLYKDGFAQFDLDRSEPPAEAEKPAPEAAKQPAKKPPASVPSRSDGVDPKIFAYLDESEDFSAFMGKVTAVLRKYDPDKPNSDARLWAAINRLASDAESDEANGVVFPFSVASVLKFDGKRTNAGAAQVAERVYGECRAWTINAAALYLAEKRDAVKAA